MDAAVVQLTQDFLPFDVTRGPEQMALVQKQGFSVVYA